MTDSKHTPILVKATAQEIWDGQRLDAFWADSLQDRGVSRERVKQLIRDGRAVVNGRVRRKPSFRLAAGDELGLGLPEQRNRLAADSGELHLLFSDQDVAVADKPAGLTTHPAPSVNGPTLVGRLLHRFPQLAEMEGDRPGVVHRLDKETSGVMVAALNERARLALTEAFAGRETIKVYLAVLNGRPEKDEGVVEAPIGRDPRSRARMAVAPRSGRPAASRYKVVWSSPDGLTSLVLVRIFTGRTHQIRVHMAHLGCPVAGDPLYGSPAAACQPSRMMLHALRLVFPHPGSGERMAFTSWPGDDFMHNLRKAADSPLRAGLTGMPGSGKSALGRMLAEHGVPVFSADQTVAELYRPGGDGFHMLAARYGDRFADPVRGVDKSALFQAMNQDPALRREVMDMIHPMVEARYEAFCRSHANAGWTAAEVPLLAEGRWPQRGLVDLAVGVHAPASLRKGPFARARGADPETLDVLESWQYPEKDKLAVCQLVVPNHGSLKDLAAKARALADIAEWLGLRRLERRMHRIAAGVSAGLEELSAS